MYTIRAKNARTGRRLQHRTEVRLQQNVTDSISVFNNFGQCNFRLRKGEQMLRNKSDNLINCSFTQYALSPNSNWLDTKRHGLFCHVVSR